MTKVFSPGATAGSAHKLVHRFKALEQPAAQGAMPKMGLASQGGKDTVL